MANFQDPIMGLSEGLKTGLGIGQQLGQQRYERRRQEQQDLVAQEKLKHERAGEAVNTSWTVLRKLPLGERANHYNIDTRERHFEAYGVKLPEASPAQAQQLTDIAERLHKFSTDPELKANPNASRTLIGRIMAELGGLGELGAGVDLSGIEKFLPEAQKTTRLEREVPLKGNMVQKQESIDGITWLPVGVPYSRYKPSEGGSGDGGEKKEDFKTYYKEYQDLSQDLAQVTKTGINLFTGVKMNAVEQTEAVQHLLEQRKMLENYIQREFPEDYRKSFGKFGKQAAEANIPELTVTKQPAQPKGRGLPQF